MFQVVFNDLQTSTTFSSKAVHPPYERNIGCGDSCLEVLHGLGGTTESFQSFSFQTWCISFAQELRSCCRFPIVYQA